MDNYATNQFFPGCFGRIDVHVKKPSGCTFSSIVLTGNLLWNQTWFWQAEEKSIIWYKHISNREDQCIPVVPKFQWSKSCPKQNETQIQSLWYIMAYNKHAEHIPKGTKVTDSPEAFKKDHRSIQRHIFSCHTAKVLICCTNLLQKTLNSPHQALCQAHF